jgi:hypothetical protein
MTLTVPQAAMPINDDWTTGTTRTVNGFFRCTSQIATGPLVMTGTLADIPGMTLNVTTTGLNAIIFVTATYDVNVTVASAADTVVQCTIGVNAVDITSPEALFAANTTARGSCTMSWIVSAPAGAYAIQGRALKPAAATANINPGSAGHTNLAALVFDNP